MRHALPRLTRHWRVYALVRQRDPMLAALGITQLLGDLDHAPTLRRLRGIAQAVIHSAPPPDSGDIDARTRRLIAALQAGGSLLQRLVYISTTGVYGDCGGARIDETRTLAPLTARARRRVDAETRLRRFGIGSDCRVSILRAPGIYAAERLPLERLRQGLPLFAERDDVFTNHVHGDDLAAACSAALRHGRPNRVYNICDDSTIRMGDWYDQLADAFALPRAPRLPRAEAEQVLPPLQLSFMRESRRIGNERMKRELKLRLRYPTIDDGIRAAARPS
ncbi:NAD-dependent epimerase/dehydratase [Georgfuchsia toluolica]|uniref:NAD-dependent epimerase/dehydratase n=2 Tax=Georgfuchsia toluolica TaxID=424218 RepID=A0A916N0J0_9PROT|nr:NAD-dependent epimerase/dehydratase [Georgfuchsia toluolica]